MSGAGARGATAAAATGDGRIALAVFFAAIVAYLSNLSVIPLNADTAPSAYLPASILNDGDLAFSPFEAPFMFVWKMKRREGEVGVSVTSWTQVPAGSTQTFAELYRDGQLLFAGSKYYLVPTVRERPLNGEPLFVSTFGPAAGLAALPLAVLADRMQILRWQDATAGWWVAKLTAASLAAASAAFVYLTAVGFVSRGQALLVAGAYALGTGVWAISSQSLWQQTPTLFFLSLGVLCLVRLPESWLRGAAAGLAFSAAAACRPTAVLVGVVVGAWLLVADRRALVAFVLAALPLAFAVLAYNNYYFGAPLEFGQLAAGERVARYKTGSAELWQTPLWLGAAGLLVSPSRGLLVYSPFLGAAFAGAVIAWKDPRYDALRVLVLGVAVLWLPAFLWFDWWGGWAYGYRPIVDSVPLLALLCVPALAPILARPAWRYLFIVALVWSIFVQVLGAYAYSPWGWNQLRADPDSVPADVDRAEYRHRLWSVRDWQIGYLVTDFCRARAERELAIDY